jgi:hypothetical protein
MSELQEIPPITHPLGRYWDQPPRSEILVDDSIALMSRATFGKLMRYDTSFPSGVYEGKMWARSRPWQDDRLYLCWYAENPDPAKCSVISREVHFVD